MPGWVVRGRICVWSGKNGTSVKGFFTGYAKGPGSYQPNYVPDP